MSYNVKTVFLNPKIIGPFVKGAYPVPQNYSAVHTRFRFNIQQSTGDVGTHRGFGFKKGNKRIPCSPSVPCHTLTAP